MQTQTSIVKKLTAPASTAWAAISGIGGLDRWFPIIKSCGVEGNGEGAIRHLTLEDGGEMIDHIRIIDHDNRLLRYHRVSLPFPVTDYFGTVEIFKSFDQRAVINWTIQFNVAPEDKEQILGLIHTAISDGIDGMNAEIS